MIYDVVLNCDIYINIYIYVRVFILHCMNDTGIITLVNYVPIQLFYLHKHVSKTLGTVSTYFDIWWMLIRCMQYLNNLHMWWLKAHFFLWFYSELSMFQQICVMVACIEPQKGDILQEKNIPLNWKVAAICEAYQYYSLFTNCLFSLGSTSRQRHYQIDELSHMTACGEDHWFRWK